MKTGQIFDLDDCVASVTGGSVGLGLRMAEGLVEKDAHLVLCARKKERCLETASVAAMTPKARLCFLPPTRPILSPGTFL